MPSQVKLSDLQDAVAGTAAAFRCKTELQPVGGPGTKIFPPTYEGGSYATEERRLPEFEEPVPCVVLDSVPSQANRMELSLLRAWEEGRLSLPVISVQFPDEELPAPVGKVTSLEAPHRIADSLLRFSVTEDGTLFRDSEYARRWGGSRLHDATALFELCPTALIFGTWGSPQSTGGLGAKFPRTVVSEIVGIGVTSGVATSSRIDPVIGTTKGITLFEGEDDRFAFDAGKKFGKTGRVSEANLGNVTPSIEDTAGGVTIRHAVQTTTLSLPALRRLRFPVDGASDAGTEVAARMVLAALALTAAALNREEGYDLRSRCQLHPTHAAPWELLDRPGGEPDQLTLTGDEAIELYNEAVERARQAGLPWMEEELVLTPSDELLELVSRSQELSLSSGEEAEDG